MSLNLTTIVSSALLDDLDKELNNYIMRCREWYGWHFPELGKVITDNLAYCKSVRKIGNLKFSPKVQGLYGGFLECILNVIVFFPSTGDRTNVAGSDLSDILPEEIEADVKLAAEISMGTEVSEQDINNIMHLCDQVCPWHSPLPPRPLRSRPTVLMITTLVTRT